MDENDETQHWARTPIGIASLAFTGIAALLIIGYVLLLRWDYETIYQNLEPADAALIVSELEDQDINYRLSDQGSSIKVPARQASAIRLKVGQSVSPTKSLVGFELFNESEMGLTDFAQKIKYQRALQGELARTIMMIDGIKNARVHIAVPERALFRSEQTAPTAAITLVTETAITPDDSRIKGIRQIVAAAVPNLNLDDVVIMEASGKIIGAPHNDVQMSSPIAKTVSQPINETVSPPPLPPALIARVPLAATAIQTAEPVTPNSERAQTPTPAFVSTNTLFVISLAGLILLFCALLARKWFTTTLPSSEHERMATQLTSLLKPPGALQNDAH